MATTAISPRTGKPKRKYTKRTVKSAAPKPPQEQPTEEPAIPSTEQMAEITSRNILPKLKTQFTDRINEIDGDIARDKQVIRECEDNIKALDTEREKVQAALKVLK